MKTKKIVLVALIVIIAVGIFINDRVKKSEHVEPDTSSEQQVTIIEDAVQFSRITVDELKNIMGEPVSEEIWKNGSIEMTTMSYDKNSNHYEFIIADGAVVRLSIYSSAYWTNSGDRFTILSKKENICEQFNIVLGDNVKKTTDNNFTYTLSPVNDKIAMFDVQDINDDTYGFVKITYNLNYFN